MKALQGIIAILGRVCLCAAFAAAAYHHTQDFQQQEIDLSKHLSKHKVLQPYSWQALLAAIVCLSVGSLSIIIGYKARFGAFLLLVFLGVVTYFYHDFWDKTTFGEWQAEFGNFLRNLSFAGAMLFILANGAGAASLDRCLKERKTPPGPIGP
jgi:putative oxidoreductase